VRPNVVRSLPYAHHVFAMKRRLNPLNLVPKMADITKAMSWTIEELEPDMEFISRMCQPIAVLGD
jgi:hypothetical protein